MTRAELRAIILAHPTEAPSSIAERIGLTSRQVGHARSYLIEIGKLAPLADPICARIPETVRTPIVAMRLNGATYARIARHFGCGSTSVRRICDAAMDAGELPKPQIDRGGLGDTPAPAPRAPQGKEPPCRWALSLMARGMSEIKAREQARLDRHKRKLEPWEGAGPFHS
jgi:transposase-like protein